MNIIAIDLGKFKSMLCFYDNRTRSFSTALALTSREYFRSVLQHRRPDLVVVEACGPSGWVKDLCDELGIPIIACSTHEAAWRFRNVRRKTDKDDAIKLARLAALGQLQPTHVPAKVRREQRRLIRYRKILVDRITRSRNTIRAIFANQGITITTTGSATWARRTTELVDHALAMDKTTPDELWRGELDMEFAQIDHLQTLLKTVDRRLEQLAEGDEQIRRVQTIPGVGRVTAEAIVAWIDNPHRFANANQVGAYAGLVPRQYQSGNTDRRGRITKRGSKVLRSLLVECAWSSLRYNTRSRQVYARIHCGTPSRKKKAAIALARKILVVAWAMMRTETDYDPARNLCENTELCNK
jgi:transposase